MPAELPDHGGRGRRGRRRQVRSRWHLLRRSAVRADLQGRVRARYLAEASKYTDDVIACTRDICNYIYDTHGRFPAHVEAIHVPGVWLQVHHVEEGYYEQYFRNGLTDAHRSHDEAGTAAADVSV